MNSQVNDVSTPGLDEAGTLAAERSDGGVAGGGKNPAPESFALLNRRLDAAYARLGFRWQVRS